MAIIVLPIRTENFTFTICVLLSQENLTAAQIILSSHSGSKKTILRPMAFKSNEMDGAMRASKDSQNFLKELKGFSFYILYLRSSI